MNESLSSHFFWRRIHSLTGLGIVFFLFIHLFTNSQAALFLGDDGKGFIHSVNAIHDLPYLPFIEFLFLAVPLLIHALWGIKYLKTARYNSFGNSGRTPYLPEYPRNHAYTWQRVTSWILLIGIFAHVVHMRFIEYPISAKKNFKESYLVTITNDEGLSTLAARLGVTLYTKNEIQEFKLTNPLSPNDASFNLVANQAIEQEVNWGKTLKTLSLNEGEIAAVSPDFGTAELLMIRNAFKNPLMVVLYTILVIAASFHAFNGLWTFMISWGITLTEKSQLLMRLLTVGLMLVTTLLGLSAVWLTYWINLKQ